MATTAELNVRITAEDEFSGPLDRLHKGLGGLSGALSAPMAAIKGIGSALSGIGLAAQGASAIGEGAVGLANAFGFGLAKELEDTRTKMVAFAGSAAAADDILAQVRTEANQTPFAFKEMADATAALLPASKAAGVGLMDVIKQAEVLAALNPSEGLTGAAFSLREALSGDFTSWNGSISPASDSRHSRKKAYRRLRPCVSPWPRWALTPASWPVWQTRLVVVGRHSMTRSIAFA